MPTTIDTTDTARPPSWLDVETANFVRAAANRIRGHNIKVVEVDHRGRPGTDRGQGSPRSRTVRPRLDLEFAWTDRTARNYMRTAEVFGKNGNTVSVLPPATIYKLAAKSTPQTIVGSVITRLEHDQRVDPREVEADIEAAREHARQVKAEAKLTDKQRKAEERAAVRRKRDREEEERRRLDRQAADEAEADARARCIFALLGNATKVRAFLAEIDDAFSLIQVLDHLRRVVDGEGDDPIKQAADRAEALSHAPLHGLGIADRARRAQADSPETHAQSELRR